MRRIIAILVMGALAGCATVSREECATGDWAAIGARDGARGLDPDAIFARHQTACARVDVTPDRARWQQGYARGLAQFCTPQGGLEAGRAGRIYRDICPAAATPRFRQGFELGRAAHLAEERVRMAQADLRRASSAGAADGSAASVLASDRLAAQLDLMSARAELDRIEREIRAFQAGL